MPGDQGAHGDFDYKAHERSPETWLSLHRRSVLGTLAAGAAAVTLLSAAAGDPGRVGDLDRAGDPATAVAGGRRGHGGIGDPDRGGDGGCG